MLPVYIVAIVVGIPVISSAVTKIVRIYYANRAEERSANSETEVEALKDIQAGLGDLKRRVENLETILLDLDSRRK